MKISVIVPNYNHSRYLEKRIDSILNQTFQDFELIILDDCSTDNSKDIIRQYKGHEKVGNIIFNECNSGSVFKQWKSGISLAKGEYIWIAESDDCADLEFLYKLLPVLENNKELGFVYCNSHVIDENGVIGVETLADVRNRLMQTEKWNVDYLNSGSDEIKASLIKGCTVNNASAVLFRKEALLDVNPFDIEFRYVGDWYCYLKLCIKYKMAYLSEPLNYYRAHNTNASKKLYENSNFLIEYFKLFDWIFVNVNFLKKKQITNSFCTYTRHNLMKKVNREKLLLYKKLFQLNYKLFLVFLRLNTISALKEKFLRIA